MSINSSAKASASNSESYDWASSWIDGKRVLVAGGTGGIGLGLARAFAAAGARVLATGATDSDLAAAAQTCGGGPDARPIPAAEAGGGLQLAKLDLRSQADIGALIDRLDRLDVLINCAGVIRRGAEHDPDVFAEVLEINLTGTMRLCQAARPLLVANSGSVLNIASMLSFFGGGLVPGYAASKGGVAQLTKSLAIAWAPLGVRVNALAPGWIATPLTEALQQDPSRSGPILARTPMRRWGAPQDLCGLALFLASPHASFMTGTVIPVDGGYSIC